MSAVRCSAALTDIYKARLRGWRAVQAYAGHDQGFIVADAPQIDEKCMTSAGKSAVVMPDQLKLPDFHDMHMEIAKRPCLLLLLLQRCYGLVRLL